MGKVEVADMTTCVFLPPLSENTWSWDHEDWKRASCDHPPVPTIKGTCLFEQTATTEDPSGFALRLII
eukprot:765105-Hanusia_phi.AAC.3